MSSDDEVRVLVVDDNRDEAESLGALMSLNGYTVKLAFCAESALSELAEFDPHCLLLDIDMPGMDGIELSRRLRQTHQHDFIIVAVTGWSADDDAFSKSFEYIDHCLRKPVDPEKLARVLPPRRAV
jgi:CheY-like chemotaxis protein